MKLISTDQQAYGDSCVFEVEDSDRVKRPYCGNKNDMRDAVLVGSYADGQPKYQFIEPKDAVNGADRVTVFYPIGD